MLVGVENSNGSAESPYRVFPQVAGESPHIDKVTGEEGTENRVMVSRKFIVEGHNFAENP